MMTYSFHLIVFFLASSVVSQETISQRLVSRKRFKYLMQMFETTDIMGELADCMAGPYTFFAPSKKALRRLKRKGYDIDSFDNAFKDKMIRYHIVLGSYPLTELKEGDSLETLEGSYLSIANTMKVIRKSTSKKEKTFCNGFFHTIDDFLLAPDLDYNLIQDNNVSSSNSMSLGFNISYGSVTPKNNTSLRGSSVTLVNSTRSSTETLEDSVDEESLSSESLDDFHEALDFHESLYRNNTEAKNDSIGDESRSSATLDYVNETISENSTDTQGDSVHKESLSIENLDAVHELSRNNTEAKGDSIDNKSLSSETLANVIETILENSTDTQGDFVGENLDDVHETIPKNNTEYWF